MNINSIEKFVEASVQKDKLVDIHFKGRPKITGVFIYTSDYEELKYKNMWRIVDASRVKQWLETSDVNLARIFNGLTFTSISNAKL